MGIFSIFSSQIVNNIEPLIFEDRNQTRDFIAEDVAEANITMLTNDFEGQAFNVGTGKGTSVNYLAELLINKLILE